MEPFEELCDSLRRNDPATTRIPFLHLPDGYGRRLGEALEGNAFVSSMDLYLSHLLAADEGTDSLALFFITSVLRFSSLHQ